MTVATKTTAPKKSPIAKPKATKKAPAPKTPVTHTALPKIVRAMGIDPKAARAKLRKSHGAAWKTLTDDELRKLIAA